MAEGIVVKIWNVTVNKGERSGASQLANSIQYIENPEKVAMKMEDINFSQIHNELEYVKNELKTRNGLLVGGRRISDFSNATNEMMQVKNFFGKLDGRIALHGLISLDQEESIPKSAGKLMLLLEEVLEQVFPMNQVVYAVHTNTENMHLHFIVNTVGVDGKKIHMDCDFMKKVLQPIVNEKAIKYGFTPNKKWSQEHKKEVIPLPQRKMLLCKLIDHAIEETDDFASFVAYLRKDGMQINVGKHLSLQLEEMATPMRSGRLGEDYTIDGICRRLAAKKAPLVWKGIKEHSHYISEKEMLLFTPDKMKRYKDMTPEQKSNAIRLLRLKRNPWEEVRERNWRLQRMSKQLNEVGFVYELVHYYSKETDSVRSALDEIGKRRTALSEEKKEVQTSLKQNRSIVSIYEELQKYMQKAYLYDAFGRTEYIEDFKKYKELSERLETIYGKSVEEVEAFVTDQRNQLLYAKAQDQELKKQYALIKNYMEKGSFKVNEDVLSFYQAVGHGEASRNAREYGTFASDVRYITAKNEDEIVVRVLTTPDLVNGKTTITTTVTVLDKNNKVLKEICSKDLDAKAFNKAIFEIAEEYKLKDCKTQKKNHRRNL